MAARRGGPSYAGVQWVDVSQALEAFQEENGNLKALIEIEPNGLGVFTLTVKLWYRCLGEVHLSETSEPWAEAKGRLQAFAYRSVMDTIKEADYVRAKLEKGADGHD